MLAAAESLVAQASDLTWRLQHLTRARTLLELFTNGGSHPNTLIRLGLIWLLCYDNQWAGVPDHPGVRDMHFVLQWPGRPFNARALLRPEQPGDARREAFELAIEQRPTRDTEFGDGITASAVWKRKAGALALVKRVHPPAAQHLATHYKTGLVISYDGGTRWITALPGVSK